MRGVLPYRSREAKRSVLLSIQIAAMCIFASIVLIAVTTISATVQPEPIHVGVDSNMLFAFDWDGRYDDGSPGARVTAVEFRYVLTAGGAQPIMRRAVSVIVSGTTEVAVKDVLNGVPAGVYDTSVRLLGQGGQPSAYSPALSIRVRVKNPSTPTNLRVVGN